MGALSVFPDGASHFFFHRQSSPTDSLARSPTCCLALALVTVVHPHLYRNGSNALQQVFTVKKAQVLL